MDQRNLAIGFLATTAVIMLTGILVVSSMSQPVFASGMTAQGGNYILTTGQYTNNEELVYVIDSAKGLMLNYRFDSRSRSLVLSGPPINVEQLRPPEDDGKSKNRR